MQARPAWQSIALAQGPPAACSGAQVLLLPLELPLTLELAAPLEPPPTLELAATLELPLLLDPPRLLLATGELPLLEEVVPALAPFVDPPEVVVVERPPEDELDEAAAVCEPPPRCSPFCSRRRVG